MEKVKKKVLIGAFVLAFFFLLAASGSFKHNWNKVTLILDYGNNKQNVLQTTFSGKRRAWNLLQQAAAVVKIDLRANNDFVPVKIDGYYNGYQGKKWVFYVNGKKQPSSPFDTFVKPSDKVTFRFE